MALQRLDRSYEQLAAEREVPMRFVQAVHESLGFAPPEPGDRAGEQTRPCWRWQVCSGARE